MSKNIAKDKCPWTIVIENICIQAAANSFTFSIDVLKYIFMLFK